MEHKSTDELNQLLEKTKPSQLEAYLKDNSKYLAGEPKSFYYYMKNVITEKGIKIKDIYSFAGVSASYGDKILRQEEPSRSRDLIIRLCIAGHFSWNETNRALKLYGFSELYAKNPRDACIIVALNNRIYDMAEIDDMLIKQGKEIITKDEK